MASTFDNDLQLEEMATGENAGSWGTKTNTNLELIADAFGYGTATIGNADTSLTMPEGSDTAANKNVLRSLFLKITSSASLTTTRVVTLLPNTVSKVWLIENATSGSQTITIKQGSGATINILNGQTKIIATDGAGAGAAVTDLSQDLAITDLFIDDDLSLQSDGAIINFGADDDITLTHAADTSLTLGGAGSTTGLIVNNTATDGDPFLAFALSGTQKFTMGVDDGDSDKFKIGTTAIGTDTRLTIDSSGSVGIGTSTPDAIIETSSSASGNVVGALLTNTNGSGSADSVSLNFGLGRSADSLIFSIPAIKYLKEQQWTGTGSTIDASLVFSTTSNETTAERMYLTSGGNVGINATSPSPDYGSDIALEVRGSTSPGIVINDTGQASKYGIHADSNDLKITYGSGALVSFQNDGNVGIGTSDPHDAGANFSMLTLNGVKGGGIVFSDDDVNQHQIYTTDDASLRFARGSGLSDESMRISSAGSVGINCEPDGNSKLQVKGTTEINATNSTNGWQLYTYTDNTFRINYNGAGADEFVIESGGNIGIGTDSPVADVSIVDSSTGSGIELQPEVTTNTNRITNYDRVESAYKKFRLDASEHAFYISGTERFRIEDTGNTLRVGNTTNAGFIDFDSSSLQLNTQRDPNTGSFVNTGRAHAGLALSDGNGSGDSKILFYTATSNNTTATARMEVTHDGHLDIKNGNLIVSSGGNGIDFSAQTSTSATNANTTSELLDHYEEGTWRPTMKAGSTAVSLDHGGTVQGTYTRIGRLVNLHMEVDITNLNGGTGIISIEGLPFTVSNNISPTGIEASGSVSYWAGWSTSIVFIGIYASSDTKLYLQKTTAAATGPSDVTGNDIGTGEFRATISYFSG